MLRRFGQWENELPGDEQLGNGQLVSVPRGDERLGNEQERKRPDEGLATSTEVVEVAASRAPGAQGRRCLH